VNNKSSAYLLLSILLLASWTSELRATTVSTSFGISRQVNVNASGHNIPGDAANEPSLCIDPTDSNRIAIGWRQFDTTNSSFRQSGVAYTTNGGLNWTFPGNLEAGTFRSDPVLASDANGIFYYLGISNTSTFACDLLRSTNGGATWQPLGGALGGDKEWMVIDATQSPGRGNIYEVWSPFYNIFNNSDEIFSRSSDGGKSWMSPIGLPQSPYFGTLAVGPKGELYSFGTAISGGSLWINRSTDVTNRSAIPTIDLSTGINLGGPLIGGVEGLNPGGLLGQAWVAVDCSTGSTRGNVYVLCSVTNDPGNLVNVMFSRSTDGGSTWSTPVRINDDSPSQNAAHWFGTISVAPNGRIDVCWNDTRHSADNSLSELYYSWSTDGGFTWAPNRPLSPQFNHSLGYPQQNKMGDYIGMISLNECACIAYAATFNGEEDIYFVRAEFPIEAKIAVVASVVSISWNSALGVNYCVQAKAEITQPWASATNVACVTATGSTTSVDDTSSSSTARHYYRVVREP
jgi:hypothetical protein